MLWPIFSIVVSLMAFCLAAYFYSWVKKLPVADGSMPQIGLLVRNGAFTFIRREYKVLLRFVGVVSILILLFFPKPIWSGEAKMNILLAVAFILGSVLSGLAGWIGISIATIANTRSATAARSGLAPAFMAGFRGGAVMGLAVVGTSLMGAALLFIVTENPEIVLAFSFGASSFALFAKAGGGIFTKTADIAADLTGKVELGIPGKALNRGTYDGKPVKHVG